MDYFFEIICNNYRKFHILLLNFFFIFKVPEKSAAPLAAKLAFCVKATPHTAPLCPSKVPIQSPVSPCRSMGLPSVNKSHFQTIHLAITITRQVTT